MALFQGRARHREQRNSPRHLVHYPACIDLGDGSPPRNCMIWDISESGARLTVGPNYQLPEEFTLLFRRRCRVVRYADGQVGVEFLHAT